MALLKGELEELLGRDGLETLSASRGGRRTYIPSRIRDGHWLEALLGRERAERLAFRYGGCQLDIPLRPSPEERNSRIRDLRPAGRSVSAIASETGLSERQVRNILGSQKAVIQGRGSRRPFQRSFRGTALPCSQGSGPGA